MYRITMTRMTSGEVVYDKQISGYTKAYTLFNEMCDERSYEVRENPMEGTYYGGGHGHDFIIELSVNDEDSDDTQYQPF
jgi:hypothetical protein